MKKKKIRAKRARRDVGPPGRKRYANFEEKAVDNIMKRVFGDLYAPKNAKRRQKRR